MGVVEAKWLALSAVAPLAWGANYVVTREMLPADDPLWGATLRAVPAGIVLLAIARRLPHGSWWWRSTVLGVLNVTAFYLLLYIASHLLPSSVAASVMALSPLALAGFGWMVLRERPTAKLLGGAAAGIVGVLLLIGGASGELSLGGICASLTALACSSLGSALAKRWRDDTPLIALTAWQVAAGGLLLMIAAIAVEGGPPHPDLVETVGFAFSSLIATALASMTWFASISRLPVTLVGVVGLLNPITGITLGTLVAGETLTVAQSGGIAVALAGMALATTGGRRWARRGTGRSAQA